jgi:dienelactone hydrolase
MTQRQAMIGDKGDNGWCTGAWSKSRWKLPVAGFTILLCWSALSHVLAATMEDVLFPTNVVPNTPNDQPVELRARLYLPDKPELPLSAVVITPSSGGVKPFREGHYAEALAGAGIAALVVDSFAARGIVNSVHDQRLLTRWQVGNDAVAGLRWLSRDERFKPDRIAVLGVSKGGIAALDTALDVRRRWMRATSVKFAAHIALSPGCRWVNRSTATTGAPILFLLAEFDDMTPAQACVERAEQLRGAGNANVEVKVYPGAHHAWEAVTANPLFDPWAENYAGCHVWIEDDGALAAASDGASIPRRQWYEWAKRTCMKLGAHCCGGTPELKQQATRDVIAFLRKHGF